MDTALRNQLADYIYGAQFNRKEITRVTAKLCPDLSIKDAYVVQDAVLQRIKAQGHTIIGPKMGLTSQEKMTQMNVQDPIYGYVFDHMVVNDGDSISMKQFIHPKVEPEIGFVLKKDLTGPNVTLEQVLEVTDYVFPAVEIIDSRYENFRFTLPDVIADNTSAAGAIFGTRFCKVDQLELELVGVTLTINGHIQSLGAGAAVLGHPALSVARLANMLSEKGEKIKAGEPILTGGITEAIGLSAGDFVCAKFGKLGEVSFFVTK